MQSFNKWGHKHLNLAIIYINSTDLIDQFLEDFTAYY